MAGGNRDFNPDAYHVETDFVNAPRRQQNFHLGFGMLAGILGSFACMLMNSAAGAKSSNVANLWLARRVACQVGTCSYLASSNYFHYHDGYEWRTRNMGDLWGDVIQGSKFYYEKARRASATAAAAGASPPGSSEGPSPAAQRASE